MVFLDMKNIQRFLLVALCITTIFTRLYMLLACEILFYVSFEYLNSNHEYLKLSSYKIYNWLFVAFVAFVVLIRSKVLGLSDTFDFHVNTMEHLFFSGIICLTTSIYLKIFDILSDFLFMRLILIFLVFNLIGLANEFIQNLYQGRPFFSIEGNDIKDLIVNLFGSSLFVLISVLYKDKSLLNAEV